MRTYRTLVVLVLACALAPMGARAASTDAFTREDAAAFRSAFGRALAADPMHAGATARTAAAPFLAAGRSVGALLRAQAAMNRVILPSAPAGASVGLRAAIDNLVAAAEAAAPMRARAFDALSAAELAQVSADPPLSPTFTGGDAASLIAGATRRDLEPFRARTAMLRKIDQAAALGGIAMLADALDAVRAAVRAEPDLDGAALLDQDTPFGRIIVKGTDADLNTEDAFLLIDLGGNDTYPGTVASATGNLEAIVAAPGIDAVTGFRPQARLVIDAGGADTYAGGDRTQGYGRGGGFGVLVDEGIEADTYSAGNHAQGAGVLAGVGILVDGGGNNTFTGVQRTQGFSLSAGLGLLASGSGTDTYDAFVYSQGVGYDGGAGGTLIDPAGNDTYRCTGTVESASEILPISGSRPTTACHGTGYGGQGFLVDGAGDDRYHVATSFQAMALIGSGGLVDGGGTDVFDGGEWSNAIAVLGEAVISAGVGDTTYSSIARVGIPWYDTYVGSNGEGYQIGVGVLDDAAGNDTYISEVGKDLWLTQYACAAACSYSDAVGILIDGTGDDTYRVEVGQGAAMSGYAALVDGSGTDSYLLNTGDRRSQAYGDAGGPPFTPTVTSCGIGYLIDGAGTDTYANPTTTFGARANGQRWNNGDHGRGMDDTSGISAYLTEQAQNDLDTYLARHACAERPEALLPI